MKRNTLMGTLVALSSTAVVLFPVRPGDANAQTPLRHADSQFDITLDAPYQKVAPLFGASGERAWAGKAWNPQFVFPDPEADVSGAVFTVSHGPHKTLWLTPTYDLENRHIQHVIVVPDEMVTVLDIRFQPSDGNRTKVHVHYQRTALSEGASDRIRQQAAGDQAKRTDWETTINEYLGSHP